MPVHSRYEELVSDKEKDNWPTGSLEREFARKMEAFSFQASILGNSELTSIAQVSELANSNADKTRINIGDVITMLRLVDGMRSYKSQLMWTSSA